MTVQQAEEMLESERFDINIAIKEHRTHKNEMLCFDTHRYLSQIYFDQSPYIAIIKSTQSGITEYLIWRALFKAEQGRSIFYVLPTYSLVGRFVKNRIDKSILYTGHYTEVLSSTPRTNKSESMTLKDYGHGVIAFTGSGSEAPFAEFPADDLIVDELDLCDQDNIEMAWERLSASKDKRQIKISNPTIEGYGIDNEYADSCQYTWFLKCGCGHYFHPDFFNHIVRKVDDETYILRDSKYRRDLKRDIYLICDKCGRPVDRKGSGKWIAKYPKREKSGYHINKLFSTNVTIKELIARFNKGLKNQTILQRFYNADLGLAYTDEGSKISRDMLRDCIGTFQNKIPPGGYCVAGVDVGADMNIMIAEILETRLKVIYIGTIKTEDELKSLIKEYKVIAGVIDAMPETRMSKRICRLFRGFFHCFYGSDKGDTIDPRRKKLTVDRTQSLDNVKESILLKKLIFPANAEGIPDFFNQMEASTRIFEQDKNRFKWVEGSKADHYFHACAYMLMARKILLMINKR